MNTSMFPERPACSSDMEPELSTTNTMSADGATPVNSSITGTATAAVAVTVYSACGRCGSLDSNAKVAVSAPASTGAYETSNDACSPTGIATPPVPSVSSDEPSSDGATSSVSLPVFRTRTLPSALHPTATEPTSRVLSSSSKTGASPSPCSGTSKNSGPSASESMMSVASWTNGLWGSNVIV